MDGSDVEVSAVLAALHGVVRRTSWGRGAAHVCAPCSDPALHPTTCAKRGAVSIVYGCVVCNDLGQGEALATRMYGCKCSQRASSVIANQCGVPHYCGMCRYVLQNVSDCGVVFGA